MPKRCLYNMICCKALLHTCFNGYETARLIAAFISRSEEAPGSVFHPRDKSGKVDCDFFATFFVQYKSRF